MLPLLLISVSRASHGQLHPANKPLQVHELQDAGGVYTQLMALLSSLAERGLVHCDCNEFNILVRMLPSPSHTAIPTSALAPTLMVVLRLPNDQTCKCHTAVPRQGCVWWSQYGKILREGT